MGGGSWSSDAYKSISRSNSSKTRDEIFVSRDINTDMNPSGIDIRESRDSEEHPESLAIGVFLDVTGSMGHIPEAMVKEKLGPLMETLIAHGVDHPQILFGAIGDHISDDAPLQIGQFESETESLDECLKNIYIEGNGGGQSNESYVLAWLFAGRHTSIDCFEQRKQKGFLFTIGDEGTWEDLEASSLKEIMGYPQSDDLTAKQLLEEAQRMYHVFHIHINETHYKNDTRIFESWKELLGERFLILDDHNATAELIASTVAVVHGIDLATVTKDFDKAIASSVKGALSGIGSEIVKADSTSGVVDL